MMYPNIPAQLKGDIHGIVRMQCANTVDILIKHFEEIQIWLKSVND